MTPSDTNAPPVESVIEASTKLLAGGLGENLHSLILYGSAVHAGKVTAASDINLMFVLHASTAAAHRAIRDVVQRYPRLNPFVVELQGMPRAIRVFALKFLSIRRSYRVLHGEDCLKVLQVPKELELMLAEQELRNFRMRLVHTYITTIDKTPRYRRYIVFNANRLIVVLSDVLRCGDISLPSGLLERLPVFEREFKANPAVLRRLVDWKSAQHEPSLEEAAVAHGELVELCRQALNWMEAKWPKLPL